MRKLTLSPAVFVLVLLFASEGHSQDAGRRFSLSIQSGLTIHTDYLINGDYSWNGIGVDYIEAGLNYKITDKIEIGATVGRDDFSVKGSGTSYSITLQGDTNFSSYSYYGLNSYSWFAGNVNYYLNNKTFIGFKTGFSSGSAKYFSGSIGRTILNSDDWQLNSIFQLSTRFAPGAVQTGSYQINLLFNVRFKPDISGLF